MTLIVASGGCSKQNDCEQYFTTVQKDGVALFELPRSKEHRDEIVSKLDASVSAWNQSKPSIDTEQVRINGQEMATILQERRALLESIDFDSIDKTEPPPSSPPADTASPNHDRDAATARQEALDAIAEEAIEGLVGPQPVPNESVEKLNQNEQAYEKARQQLVHYCTPKRWF